MMTASPWCRRRERSRRWNFHRQGTVEGCLEAMEKEGMDMSWMSSHQRLRRTSVPKNLITTETCIIISLVARMIGLNVSPDR